MKKILFLGLLFFIGATQLYGGISDDISSVILNNNQGKKFECNSDSYIFTSDQKANYTKAININIANETITTVKDSFASSHINAIGFNPKDGYIYGWEYGEGSKYDEYDPHLVRVDADFNVYRVELEGNLTKTRFYLGDISKDGIFYIANRHQPLNSSLLQEIERVDLNSKRVLSKIVLEHNNTYSSDFAINPKDDMIYTVNAIDNQLIKIDPSSGAVIELGDTGIPKPHWITYEEEQVYYYPAYSVYNYFDKYGNFYFQVNGDEVYKIDISNPWSDKNNTKATAYKYKDVGGIRSGDGARCALAGIEKEAVPFVCDDTMYFSNAYDLTSDTQTNGTMYLHTIDREHSPFTFSKLGDGYHVEGENDNSYYNALAYNPEDNFLYATVKNRLLKIGKNGTIEELGVIEGLPDVQHFAGTFGHVEADGTAYYYLTQMHEKQIYKIDVKTKTIKETIEMDEAIYTVDMTIDETGENLYFMQRPVFNAPSPNQLMKLNIKDKTLTAIGDAVEGESLVGSTFCDSTGRVFALYDEGGFFEIDTTTGERKPISDAPQMAYLNDGAMCPSATVKLKPTIHIKDATVTEGGDLVFDVFLSNVTNLNRGYSFKYQAFDGDNSNNKLNATIDKDFTAESFPSSVVQELANDTKITIPTIQDTEIEADESLQVVLSDISGALYHTTPIARGTIIDDDKPKGTCYASTDNYNKLFIYDDLNETDGLADPQDINLSELITGEGGAYRALDGYMYVFSYSATSDNMDLKKIDVYSGEVTDVKEGLLPEHVDAVEFFYDKDKKTDVMYVTDKHGGKFYTIDTESWEKVKEQDIVGTDGVIAKIGALAIDPYSGKIYGVRDQGGFSGTDDTEPILYSLDISGVKVIATKLATLPRVDAEGLAFANDGKLYLETEEVGSEEDEHKIYRLDLQTYTLTKVANSGTKDLTPINQDSRSYVDIETLSCDAGKSLVPPIFTITQKEIMVKEGDTNGLDGTNEKDINITITANKLLDEDITFTITQSDETAKKTSDYKVFASNTFTMLKGTNRITFSSHSVIADQEVEGNEYFMCEVVSTQGRFKDEDNSVKVTIIDDDFNTLDAFDITSHDGAIIKTKKVNSPFSLKIAAVDSDSRDIKDFEGFEDILVRIVPSSGCVSQTSDIQNIENNPFALLDINNPSNDGTVLKSFVVTEAIKDAKVQFWWKNSAQEYQTTCSTDTFAVRPDRYTLSIPTLIAGKPFDINVTAVDVNGNPVTNYTEYSNVYKLDINDTKVINHNPKCNLGAVTEINRTRFKNGLSTVRLEYSEIGELQFKVSEIKDNATEYAYQDAMDGSDSDRFISESLTTTKKITASKLITTYRFTTQNGVDEYTYYSSNAKDMGAMIDLNISVQNEDGKVVKNFTDGCYAEDVNISIGYVRNGEASSVVDFNATDVVLSGGNLIEYQVYDRNFTDGNASRRVYINFGRDTLNMKEPLKIELTTTKAELTDVPDATPDINKTISFLYARAHVQNEITVVGRDLNATVDYEVYLPSGNGVSFGLATNLAKSKDDLKWSLLRRFDANLSFLSASLAYLDSDMNVTKVNDRLIRIRVAKTPKKNRIIYKAPSYLIHSDTNPNATSDSFTSYLQSDQNQWSGKGDRGKIFDNSASKNIQKRMEW